jgi:hypothetical protein
LLTSELKGFIEKPAWYFTDDRHLDEIDHLLLTQGWSRFNIADILQGFVKKPKKLPEVTADISGQISIGSFQSGKTDQYVRINAAGIEKKGLPENITAAVDKSFELFYHEYPNGTSYTLQLGTANLRAEIIPNLPVFPPNRIILPYAFNLEKSSVESFQQNASNVLALYRERMHYFNDKVLTTGNHTTGLSPFSPGRSQDRVITQSDLWRNKKLTLSQFLSSLGEIAIRSDENGMLHLRYQNGNNYYDYVVIVDDRWFNAFACARFDDDFIGNGEYSLSDLVSLPIDRIQEIEIVHAPAPPIIMNDFGNLIVNDPELYGITESLSPLSCLSPKQETGLSHPGYLGTILITTKAQNAGVSNALKLAPLGYQVSRDFYSPAYETKNKQEDPAPDLRTTIYWCSDVQTDETGKATISFYTGDICTTYTVTIEGVTQDGKLIHKTSELIVSDFR